MPWSLGTAFVTEHRPRFLNAAPAKMVGLAGNLVDTVFQLGLVSSAGRLWLPLTGTLRDTHCRVFISNIEAWIFMIGCREKKIKEK